MGETGLPAKSVTADGADAPVRMPLLGTIRCLQEIRREEIRRGHFLNIDIATQRPPKGFRAGPLLFSAESAREIPGFVHARLPGE